MYIYSLIKAINAKLNHHSFGDVTQNIFNEYNNSMRKAGIVCEGDIFLPTEYRADIKAQTATAGQEIVSEDKKAILAPLKDNLVFTKAGATFLTGLVGDVSIPSYAGTSVAWKGEVETAVDGGGAFSEVNFAPKRLTAFINVSKTFLAQDGVGAERLLLDNISDAVARKFEATILGPATVSSTIPSGIGYKLNVANGGGVVVLTTATVTYAALVGLETTIDIANAGVGNLAYITNSTAAGILKTKDKGTSNDTGDYIIGQNVNSLAGSFMNGYPVLVTNSIGSTYGAGGDGNAVYFGNWKDLCVAQWGNSYDITVDPYTAAKTNQVVITVNAYLDCKGLRGSTGATSTLDQYAMSFAALSLKA